MNKRKSCRHLLIPLPPPINHVLCYLDLPLSLPWDTCFASHVHHCLFLNQGPDSVRANLDLSATQYVIELCATSAASDPLGLFGEKKIAPAPDEHSGPWHQVAISISQGATCLGTKSQPRATHPVWRSCRQPLRIPSKCLPLDVYLSSSVCIFSSIISLVRSSSDKLTL